jgi:hypothetical protein
VSRTRGGIVDGSSGSRSRWAQRESGVGQLVASAASFPDLPHDAVVLQRPQTRGEDVRADAAEAVEQFGVRARTEEQVAHDQQRPALADDVERRADGTEGLVADRGGHAHSIAC